MYLEHQANMKIPEAVGFVKNYPVKFGISVSTKHFKRAVDRNRVKRISREAWRLHKQDLYSSLLEQDRNFAIFFIYTQKEILTYTEVEKGMTKAIQKLKNLFTEKAQH
jgi:ribonuclease P protein component